MILRIIFPSIYATMIKPLFISLLIVILVGCAGTLPKPSDTNSSLIVVSVEAERALGTNRPDFVTILRKEDSENIKHTAKNGKYFYFTNLAPGTYQIDAAQLTIKSGSTSSASGAVTTTFSMSMTNSFPFNDEVKNTSTIKLDAGEVAFMGKITAEGTSKIWPPGAIEFSNVKISKTEIDEKTAFDAIKKTYKDNPWIKRL